MNSQGYLLVLCNSFETDAYEGVESTTSSRHVQVIEIKELEHCCVGEDY